MIPATLVKISEVYSSPPHIIGLWSCLNIPAGTDSTSLIMISLPAHNFFLQPWSVNIEKRLKGKAYAIDLRMFSASCFSNNYSITILNKNDIALLNTVYEVGQWSSINLSVSDILEDPFLIKNKDDILINQIYFYIQNSLGTVDTGTISIELTYVVMQDRLDSEF
jgi:hypothetical protein